MKMLVKITKSDGSQSETVEEGQWDEGRGCWSFNDPMIMDNGDTIQMCLPAGIDIDAANISIEPRQ